MKTLPHFLPFQDLTVSTALYAIELDNGVVKVGRSNEPRRRFRKHYKDFKAMGRTMVRWVVYPTPNGPINEYELLSRMNRLATPLAGREEMFLGLRFGAAATLVRQIARRELVSRYSRSQQPA